MVKVIKKNKKVQPFKSAKIAKACRGAGVPAPIAETIAKMVTKKVKARKIVRSSEIKKMVFSIFDSVTKAKKHWISFKKKRR